MTHGTVTSIARWFDDNILSLAREMRLSYLPPLMVYIAAGVSGLTGIVGTFFIKEYLGVPAAFLASVAFWAGIPWAAKMPLGHLVDLIWRWKGSLVVVGAALIALSIVYVAVENILTPKLKPWRIFVVFGFGLLHGMGFAGVLTELGLPANEYVTALIAFNVGVEFGQLAVIALAFLATGLWLRRHWYRRAIVIPASIAIAATGAYWTVERVVG